MAKETTTEKYIKKAVEAAKGSFQGVVVSDCNFAGVKFNKKATQAMIHIADALETNAEACRVNAKALKNLSSALVASEVQIGTLLKVG